MPLGELLQTAGAVFVILSEDTAGKELVAPGGRINFLPASGSVGRIGGTSVSRQIAAAKFCHGGH
jgi:hypothetical protein